MIKKISCLFILCLIVSFLFAQEKEKTEITGDVMEIKKSGEKTIVKGNAKVVRGNSIVKSDQLTYYKNSSQVDASGNVDFFVINDDSSTIKATSQEAIYNTENSSGWLWGGKPTIEYNIKDSTDTLYLYADKLYLGERFESAQAESNVEIISSSGTIISDNAFLNRKENTLFMYKDKKKPQINAYQKDKTAEFKADELLLLYNDKTIKMNKNVEGKIIMDTLGANQ